MRVAELLNSIEDDVDMVKTEPRSDSEEPWGPSPTPSMSPASTPSSASFTPDVSPAGPSRAVGSDVGDSDMIDIKMEVAEEEPGIDIKMKVAEEEPGIDIKMEGVEEEPGIAPVALLPAPPPFRRPRYHQSVPCPHHPMSAWQRPPPTLGWAPWMAPPAGLYSLHRLDNSPQGPMWMSDADMAYALALPAPKETYLPHECNGLTGGPSLLAFHCYMLQFRLPKLQLHGMSIRDLAFEYLDADRGWHRFPKEDTLGIATERLAWRVVAAIMSFREADHVHNFVEEVHEAMEGPRPDLSSRNLGAGLHGTLSMLRVMVEWCQEPAAVEMAETLVIEIVLKLCFHYLGHHADGIHCGRNGGIREIFTSYSDIEDDLGMAVEITSFWPEGARQFYGVHTVTITGGILSHGVTYTTKVATIVSEMIDILEERIDCDRWPEEVADYCAQYHLTNGPWYVYSCLWHLDQWLCGSRASPGLKGRISDALQLVNRNSHTRRFSPVSAPEEAPATKCGLCGCRPNWMPFRRGPSH